MKIITKVATVKEKVCEKCKLKKTCGDIRGLCIMFHYGLIALVVIMVAYFLITMNL